MKQLTNDVPVNTSNITISSFVIVGGWLLHKVKWQQGLTYGEIVQQYVSFIRRHYVGNIVIVFDGYLNGPSTKDHEHDIRSVKCAPDVTLADNLLAFSNQPAFLSNERNKKAFVDNLMGEFSRHGYGATQASQDADTLIVSTALQIAKSAVPVSVVATDTDILALLIYHFNDSMADVKMQSKSAQCSGSVTTLFWSICNICSTLRPQVTPLVLVGHAVTGCDTVSALFALLDVTLKQLVFS